ncbi:MAG: cytochrome c [Acidobacteriaceae bacterium]|nr:cytochrome c [Acidobacteriaceae bacterium]
MKLILLIAVSSIAISQTQRSVWDGVYSADQAKRGQARYNQRCGTCHGESLEGGESAPALVGGGFLANWNALTVGDLFDRTRTTMPQDKPGSLSREANAEILAYVLSVNQFPAGSEELPQKSEVLRTIKIEATKPDSKQ